MDDPERRLRQTLARHVERRAEEAGRAPLSRDMCHQAVALVRLWQAAGEEWDQPDSFARFDDLMRDVELGPAVSAVPDAELRAAARAVAEATRTLS